MLTSLLGILMLIGQRLDTSVVHSSDFSKDELKTLAVGIAHSNELDVSQFLKVIECESGWNPKAKGDFVDGKPTSFGLVQLRFPERDWGLTKKETMQPLIAMETMAKAWKDGKQKKWTCFSSAR